MKDALDGEGGEGNEGRQTSIQGGGMGRKGSYVRQVIFVPHPNVIFP